MNIKKKVISIALVVAVLGGASAFAAQTIAKEITVHYGIKLKIDGEQKTMTDAAGNVVEPFTYNGTTYVPIRAIAEYFGADVDYDPKTVTADIETGFSPDDAAGVVLHALTSMNCYKDIQSLGDRAWELQARTLNILSYVGKINQSELSEAIKKLSTEDIPALDLNVREMEVAIKGLRETTESDYLRDSLAGAAQHLESLRLAVGDMSSSVISLALYSSTNSQDAYNDIFEYHSAADIAIDKVISESEIQYDSLYASAYRMVKEITD